MQALHGKVCQVLKVISPDAMVRVGCYDDLAVRGANETLDADAFPAVLDGAIDVLRTSKEEDKHLAHHRSAQSGITSLSRELGVTIMASGVWRGKLNVTSLTSRAWHDELGVTITASGFWHDKLNITSLTSRAWHDELNVTSLA